MTTVPVALLNWTDYTKITPIVALNLLVLEAPLVSVRTQVLHVIVILGADRYSFPRRIEESLHNLFYIRENSWKVALPEHFALSGKVKP